jgi:hypothetical protein
MLEMADFEDSDQYEGDQQQTLKQPQYANNDAVIQPPFLEGAQEAVEGEEEEESVYIKDNIVMRRIQIEGEDQEYLMDPDGNIYDMQGNFIGTANANELEEMEEDGGN